MELCQNCDGTAYLFDLNCGHRVCGTCNNGEPCQICERFRAGVDVSEFRYFIPLLDKSIAEGTEERVTLENLSNSIHSQFN
jgi:hypothetical protein